MAKAVKKKNRRLKKAVRKTLGTLFLISSIVVAAIPTEGLQGGVAKAVTREAVSVTTDSKNRIPQIDESTKIYTTGDRKYRFAYISDGGTDKIAVLLGYGGLNLENNVLNIPEAVDAYAKYTESLGTDKGYVAVGKNGNFLFYKNVQLVETGNTVSDSDGNPVNETVEVISYVPCYYDNINYWASVPFDELYYDGTDPNGNNPGRPLDPANAVQTTDPKFQRIESATVAYISNQYLIQENGEWVYHDGQYVTEATKDYGIFANNGNIRTLNVSEKLLGIGDYAFYRCGYLESITLGNGLNTIGNGAFSDCVNMKAINLDIGSNLNQIGDHAFYNCQQLESFTLPIQVSLIGDSAFEGCTSLKMIDLCSQGMFNNLVTLGRDMFKNCESLESVTFPDKCINPVYISAFEGCRSLKYISTRNNKIKFPEEAGVYTYDQFKEMLAGTPVNGAFYFEGMENSELHNLSKDNCFAFSYIDYYGGVCTNLDRYELTVEEIGGKATYEVNSSRHLISCKTEPGVKSITIPNRIGPHAVNYIDSVTFQDHCNITKVTIPSNILEIAATAFRGCHNLVDVIFETGTVLIGENAFRTQDTKSHESACPSGGSVLNDVDDSPKVKLHFTGPISATSTPFQYAMSESGKYNVETQQPAYITYYTGWPQNMEIQYNPHTRMSELVDFPSFSDLKQGEYTSSKYAYITAEHEEAAAEALSKYPDNEGAMTEYERQIVNAALKIEIPEGVQSVKSGLFKEKENEDIGTYPYPRTVTAYSLKEVICENPSVSSGDAGNSIGTFTDCDLLTGVMLMGGVEKVGDHAFAGCENLETVILPDTLQEFGLRPFMGCPELNVLSFSEHPDYECVDSIVYGPDSQGNSRTKVLELLESRISGVVNAAELSGVTEIAQEAFMGTNVSNVDLKGTTITEVPEWSFADTKKLSLLRLPYTCKIIKSNAFENSELEYVEIPSQTNVISPEAFNVAKEHKYVTFYCEPGSIAEDYAKTYGFATAEKPEENYYDVTFWDWDEATGTNVIVKTELVAAGMDANPPTPRGKAGHVFADWTFDYRGINRNIDLTARYEKEDENLHKFKVVFKDPDGNEIETVMVDPGADAKAPNPPVRPGYIFIGWQPAVTNIQADTVIWAQYKERPEDTWIVRYIGMDDKVFYTAQVKTGEDAPSIVAPVVDGYTFTGWRPGLTQITKDTDVYAQYSPNNGTGTGDGTGNGTGSGNGTGTGDGTGNGTGTDNKAPETKLYTLTVINGSGSGSYAAGSQPVIVANDPAANQEFSNWTIDPANTTIASKVLSATVITMPETNVTLTAHYKAKTGGSSTTGSGNSANSNANRPNSNAGSLSGGGTTVVIDKNGLSNTGVVSATVNGSSDNFTIKITESSAASEAVVKALLAEYGDLNNIKYFPMDISLYDSTGKTKITDTTGLSITITLPLPDSMITYAGNNKIAGVVNDRLDKLGAKFTTISGVSCITFTAEHFSPYVIYVDTNNLTAGTVSDSTPKTGDGIHPKWFLSIGLACVAVVFYMKKDKKVVKKAIA